YLSTLFYSTATPALRLHPLSLHDALPISGSSPVPPTNLARRRLPRPGLWQISHTPHRRTTSAPPKAAGMSFATPVVSTPLGRQLDRKSTRLNSSHLVISYAVFCLKKKNKT